MKKCECNECQWIKAKYHDSRISFYCKHPNNKYIQDFYEEHKLKSFPGFIGFSEAYVTKPKRKTTPKWCPIGVAHK